MNYLKVYCNLVRRAEKRGYTKKKAKELGLYVEGHHIFPRSLYGQTSQGNGRVVYLTAREHYIAHSLLEKAFIKRYGEKHPKTIKMTHAFWKMNHHKSGNKEYYSNSKLYEGLKIRVGDAVRNRCLGTKQKQEHIDKMQKTKFVYEYLITDPNGIEYTTNSLKSFCLEHNLHGPTMCYVCNGKRNHYKRWTAKIINTIRPNLVMTDEQKKLLRKARLRTYHFLSPENNIIKVEDIDEHCKDFGLSKKQMQRLARFEVEQHRGWRRAE